MPMEIVFSSPFNKGELMVSQKSFELWVRDACIKSSHAASFNSNFLVFIIDLYWDLNWVIHVLSLGIFFSV